MTLELCGFTVVCVQVVQEWAEDPALRSTSIEDQGRWGVVAHSDHLTSACQEVQDPAAQRSVQSQSLELVTSVAGTMVLNAEWYSSMDFCSGITVDKYFL